MGAVGSNGCMDSTTGLFISVEERRERTFCQKYFLF